jgi:hypothetical protein
MISPGFVSFDPEKDVGHCRFRANRAVQQASGIPFVPYRRMTQFIQAENQMAKAVARRTKGPVTTAVRRVRGGRAGWVRKNVVMDQRKLDVARRALGVETETEAIDQALDFVVFREELARGFTAVRRSGSVDDVLEGRRRA